MADTSVWTYRVDDIDLRRALEAVRAREADGEHLALSGIRFAVKDNIDVAGVPTTLGAPSLGYVPTQSADAVERLIHAGAVFAGKTNLDQFATGLVGTRSPHFGICRNPINPEFVTGGSSSGSAAAVAMGAVPVALGTDTAGSGRVPAACCGIVGMKPTFGVVSTRGVFPASPSFDCVSVFATTCTDAAAFLAVLADDIEPGMPIGRIGIPTPLRWFDDRESAALFDTAISRLHALGIETVDVPADVLYASGDMLYGSALLAERLAAFGDLIERDPAAVDPTVRSIVRSADQYSAQDAFAAMARLAEHRETANHTWGVVDALAVPTVARHPRIDEVLADPVGPNRELATYTSFVNPLGWSALAVPAGERANGLPFGISLIGPGGADAALLELGSRFRDEPDGRVLPAGYELAVVGAHLAGQPLNHELVDRGARLVARTTTAPRYRLFALPTTPPKPGLVYDSERGRAIELEVWTLPPAGFASFVAAVPRPLAIGTVELADGRSVSGFVCEPEVLAGAEDITAFGAWRAWLASR